MATFAPSAARRSATAAPIPREPPVMSAIFPSNFFDIIYLLELDICSSGMSRIMSLARGIPITTLDYSARPAVAHSKHTLLGSVAMLQKHGAEKWNYDICVISLRSPKQRV